MEDDLKEMKYKTEVTW